MQYYRALFLAYFALVSYGICADISWTHLSSKSGDIPAPNLSGKYLVTTLVFDIDGNGINDIVIGSYSDMIWYRTSKEGGNLKFERYWLEKSISEIEAGGAWADIDGDGDIDVVQGAHGSCKVWWWENPSPSFSPDKEWDMHTIKSSGGNQCHDQIFGDFDGDGKQELCFWNNGGKQLYFSEIPSNPKSEWPYKNIATISTGNSPEGLAAVDIDGDGTDDIVGGGHWFRHTGGGSFKTYAIDAGYAFSRSAGGQLIKGGPAEVVISSGDGNGPVNLYTCSGNPTAGGNWSSKKLIDYNVNAAHTLHTGDIDNDGNLDIFVAAVFTQEVIVLYGDGVGNFQKSIVKSGISTHEGRLGDIDSDGDLDIIGKTLSNTKSNPGNSSVSVDVYLNNGSGSVDINSTRLSIIQAKRDIACSNTAVYAANGRCIYVGKAGERPAVCNGLCLFANPHNAVSSFIKIPGR